MADSMSVTQLPEPVAYAVVDQGGESWSTHMTEAGAGRHRAWLQDGAIAKRFRVEPLVLRSALSEEREARTTLKSALENWGRHFDWCAIHQGTSVQPVACSCGLAAELRVAPTTAKASFMTKEWCMDAARREMETESLGAAAPVAVSPEPTPSDDDEEWGVTIDWDATAQRMDEALGGDGQMVKIHRATLSLALLAVRRLQVADDVPESPTVNRLASEEPRVTSHQPTREGAGANDGAIPSAEPPGDSSQQSEGR